ncbi:MAG: DUF4230 domain-containing protein [Chloroflexi bacterium]|nr:DUF4230 domain-containing protein [Chloroflexota bacterium]
MDNNNIQHLLKIIKYGLVLAIVILIINFFTPIGNSVIGLLDRLAPPPVAEVLSSHTIINSLRGIGKLVTVTSDPHYREISVAVKSGFLDSGYYAANHEVEGIIEAGIDFTKVKVDSLQCDDKCTLVVPAPVLTNCIIVRIRQTEQSLAIGARDWELLEELGRHEAIRLFVEDVTEIGIFDKAKEETELALGDFVSNLTGKAVDIVFEDQSEEIELDGTCDLDPPFSWTKDSEGEWSRSS